MAAPDNTLDSMLRERNVIQEGTLRSYSGPELSYAKNVILSLEQGGGGTREEFEWLSSDGEVRLILIK